MASQRYSYIMLVRIFLFRDIALGDFNNTRRGFNLLSYVFCEISGRYLSYLNVHLLSPRYNKRKKFAKN